MKLSADLQYMEQKIIFFKLLNGSIVFGWIIFGVWLAVKLVEQFVG